MNELIQILRDMADVLDSPQNAGNLVVPAIIGRFREAAGTIEQLESENAALREEIEGLNDSVERRDYMLVDQDKALSDLRKRFDIISDFEQSQCAKLLAQIADKDKQIKQWENALSAFDDGVEPTQDVMDLLSNPDELKKWIARAAWHCKKVHDQNAEIEKLKTDLARVTVEQDAAIADLKECDIDCNYCLHTGKYETCNLDCEHCDLDCKCAECQDNSIWQWRGPQKEENGNDN